MTDPSNLPTVGAAESDGATGVESKVKWSSFATFLAALVATSFLGNTATDYVSALPDWLEAPAYSLLLTAVTYVSGYATRNKPSSISPSSYEAVLRWLKAYMPRR